MPLAVHWPTVYEHGNRRNLRTGLPSRQLVDRLVRAEEQGFTHGWTFDSHLLWQEPIVL